MCYNMLAEIYSGLQVHPYCPAWAISWEYRRNLLMREILSKDCDILCLQEIQADHFEQFFYPHLSQQGYEGIFKRKTRDSMTMNADAVDGCAIFFKRDRFTLSEQYGIDFNALAYGQTNNPRALRRLIRGNVALVAVLEESFPPMSAAKRNVPKRDRDRKRKFCVANTHIYWDPEFDDVKLWQTWMLLQELEKLLARRSLPLILCGDFNSLVESSVYELLTTKRYLLVMI